MGHIILQSNETSMPIEVVVTHRLVGHSIYNSSDPIPITISPSACRLVLVASVISDESTTSSIYFANYL